MKSLDKEFGDIKVSDCASFERTISTEDMNAFAQLSGDYNPLHLEEDYAAKTELKGTVVYGMLLAALVSRLVGMDLPGKRALLLTESLEFKKPARVGDLIIVEGIVRHKSLSTRILELDISIKRSAELLAIGSVSVKVLP